MKKLFPQIVPSLKSYIIVHLDFLYFPERNMNNALTETETGTTLPSISAIN